MSKLKLTLACWDYDRTRPLIDGRVQPEGIDLEVEVLRPRETLPRMLEEKAISSIEACSVLWLGMVTELWSHSL